jgi:hypothetical protein
MFYWTQDVLVDPNDSSQNTWYACVYEGWGVAAATGVGGLYKTTNRGISWVKIWSNERCMSASISPQNPNEMYVTTEYDGLQFSDNLNSSAPIFTQTNYPFRSPMRVFFNPYNTNEVWVSSFGQGLMVGSNITTWMNHSQDKNLSFTYYPNPVKDELNIQSVSDDNGLITVYSLLGEILGQYNVVSSLTTISMQTLPPGIYLVNIQQHGKEVTWQVVKE